MCFILKRDKRKALNLLKQKINGEIKITYQEITDKSNYSLPQIKRLSKEIEKKDTDDLLVHGLTGRNSNNSAPNQEIEYIKNFKNQYPVINIAQFMDIYQKNISTICVKIRERATDIKRRSKKSKMEFT